MEGAGKLFILASILYLAAGTILGLLMASLRGKWVLRLMPSHVHIGIVGWISMMIFGFSYSFMPALIGKALFSQKLPYIHFIMINTGLIGMSVVWIASRFPKSAVSPKLVWPFGLLVVFSLWLYIFNIVMTFFS